MPVTFEESVVGRIEVEDVVVQSDSTYIGPHWRPNVLVLDKKSGTAAYVHELVGFRMKTQREAEEEAERWAKKALEEIGGGY